MPSYTFTMYAVKTYQITVGADDVTTAQGFAASRKFDPEACLREFVDEAPLVETNDPNIKSLVAWNTKFAAIY